MNEEPVLKTQVGGGGGGDLSLMDASFCPWT